MSTLELQRKIRENSRVSAGEPFSVNQLSLVNNYNTNTVQQAINIMVKDGELTRLPDGQYRRDFKAALIARGPWRTMSNEELFGEVQA
ncbi:MAG: hypothetical protein ACPGF8_05440 [Opitutales bacterium]